MAGKGIIIVAMFCVSWGASYPSEEYLTLQPTEMEAEPGSLISSPPPTQEVIKSESTLIEHQATNEDPDLVVRTDSIQSLIEQETDTNTPRTAQVDPKEHLAPASEENVETSTVNNTDHAENTEITTLAKETQPSTKAITIYNGTEPTDRIKEIDSTTINSQALDWITPQSVEGSETTTTSNVNDKVTQPSDEHKSQELLSTMSDDIPTTLEIDHVHNFEYISTMPTDDTPGITSSSSASEPSISANTVGNGNRTPNSSELLTTHNSAFYPTTTIGSLLNDVATTNEDYDERTVPSLDDIHLPSRISVSPTVDGPDIFQNTNTLIEITEKIFTEPINLTNSEIPEPTKSSSNVLSTESIPVEILASDIRETTESLATSSRPNFQTTEPLTTSSRSNFQTTEPLATSSRPNFQTTEPLTTSSRPNILCNHDNPCSDDQVCVLENGECFCVSNLNSFSNVPLCENVTGHEVMKPSNESVSINPDVENSTSDLDQGGHREFSHTFLTKKWSELTTRQKSRNIITVSFSPAMEVVEWFQSYDWKYRKYVSTVITACMHHSMINGSKTTWVFTPSDFVYVAPSPHYDDLAINVSFLVHNPWDNTFIHNTVVVGCLNEGREDCEAKFQLTVNSVEGSFPNRLLGDCSIRVAGLSAHSVKLLFIGAVISLALAFLSLLVFTMKCRQARGRFDPRSGLYRHPRVLTRSPGDGHNLATDEQCQQDEGRRRASENIGKGDSDTWVVPLEEMEVMERDTKSEKEDDTKI